MGRKFIELHPEFEDPPRKIILSTPGHLYSPTGTTGSSYSIRETVDEIKALTEKGNRP